MKSKDKESTEMGKKSKDSGIENRNKTHKPNTVKYYYFDKDGRQLSEETVEKLKINVKGNVVLSSGLAGTRTDGTNTNPTLSENVTSSGTQKTSLQQANMKPEASVKPEKTPSPNFQASHNGQIYLVTPDGGLRSAIGNQEIRIGDDGQEQRKSIPKIMPGTNIEYRQNGTNYLNRNGKIKRPMNAFMLWAREFRGKLAERMPNASNAEISVGLGQVWANLPASEKQYFYLEAERIKNQHRRDFPGWVYQPNITKRQNQKDAQHTRLWQRFVNNKEAASGKETGNKESKYRPIAPATQQDEKSGDDTTTSEPKVDESKTSKETATSKFSESLENTQPKIQVKPTQNLMTLDQQKQQQESKIDAQTIQSTVKQVVVTSSSQVHNQNPIPSFHQFKQELMSSEKLRNIATYVQNRPEIQPGERTTKAPATSGNVAHHMAPLTTASQKVQPTGDFHGAKVTNQIDRPGRPNSVVMQYNYIPGSTPISLIPTTRPLVTPTVAEAAEPLTKHGNQLGKHTQQQFLTLETQKPPNHQSWTMMNQSVSQQKGHVADLTSQSKQTTRNKLQSNSSDQLHFPIAIPNLPNMNGKADPLWPFPFPPVEQTPQTHLLYEGTVPDTVYSKTDLSDPYAPFYFDNYINQIRATELQVDVNGWQQYLDDGHNNGAGKQSVNYFSNVKQCPSDLEICPSPASNTLSRNQGSNTSASMWPASSTASGNKQNKYLSLELGHDQQDDLVLSTKTTPSSSSVSQDGTTLQLSTSAQCQETPMQQTEVIQAMQNTGDKSSFVPQELSSKETSSGNGNGTMVKNFENRNVTSIPMYYTDDSVNVCGPPTMPKNPEKTGGIEFGSIMSNAVNALHGDLEAYESTTVPGYNEPAVPYLYPQADVQPLYVQPSASNDNFQVSKYQVENNRPIKKRSYKIIEGLLENEVWMSQFRPKTSSSSISQTQCSVEMTDESTVSNREEATESNREELLGKNKNKTKDVLLEDKDNKTEDQNEKSLEDDETTAKDPNRGEILEDIDKAKNQNREDLLKDNENATGDLNKEELLEVNKTKEDQLHSRNQGEDGQINEESSKIVCDGKIEINQECKINDANNNVADTSTLITASSNESETVTDGDIPLNEVKEKSEARNENIESEATSGELEDVEEQLAEAEATAREVMSADLGESSEIKQEIREKDKREYKTQEDTDMQILEEEQDCDNEPKEEFQHFEIVIDNAEKMSSTSCEKLHLIQKTPSLKETDELQTFSTKISSAQMSEILEDGDTSTDDEKNEICNSSDSSQHPVKIQKSLNSTKRHYAKGLQSLESGDATISSKKIVLESENTSASPGKTRNKRRRPYDSPVRMSKRRKQ
ncbi:uncharacterized protein LOC134255018 [Saccostrea cucullata]|uniref:uncharacterized protein LOC134255018 n=1 Tax=Saccostrea cuccullata TaxID=36930 RepID=UPI002ED4E90B